MSVRQPKPLWLEALIAIWRHPGRAWLALWRLPLTVPVTPDRTDQTLSALRRFRIAVVRHHASPGPRETKEMLLSVHACLTTMTGRVPSVQEVSGIFECVPTRSQVEALTGGSMP
jgi:hypothetical protein